MRRSRSAPPTTTAPIAAIAAMAVLTVLAGTALAADDMPKRKSGLWEIKMGAGGPTMSQCVDQSRDEAFRQMSARMAHEMKCETSNVQKGAGTYAFQQSCQMGKTKMTSATRVTGNFDTGYTMESQSKYDPPMMGMSESKTVMEAKWLGPCKAGQRPGDMTMPGGMTMNVYDMLDTKKK